MKEFTKAFVAAQKEMKPALKESDNPFFKSRYADLASIDAACRSALNAHDIAISQQIDFEGNVDFIRTELIHTSGEKLVSKCRIINTKGDNQSFGGSVSYMRRYSLAAICGVPTLDDDGNTADNKSPGDFKSPTPITQIQAKLSPTEYVCQLGKFKGKKLSEIKDFEILNYMDWIKQEGLTKPDFHEFVRQGEKYLKAKQNPKEPVVPIEDDIPDWVK